MPYKTPERDVVAIIDAPPTPVALLAPGGRYVALVHYESHPPVWMLARPYRALAGIRVDPALAARQRVRRLTGLSVLRLADGAVRAVALPDGAQPSMPAWAPDGRMFAFTVDEADGIGVWVGDAQTAAARQVPGLRVRDVLGGDPLTIGAAVRWSRDGASLVALGAPGGPPSLPEAPEEPHTEETAGKRSQMATYQDLLRTTADEDAFEALATSVPLRVDPRTGDAKELGPPGLYQRLADSPDGEHLLVHRLRRPFSFRVPYQYFARTVEVWSAAGDLERVVAELGVSDEVPRQGVPTGPRQVFWEERAPASLVWTEALDGGDPVAPAEHRDRLMRLAAPFTGEPERLFDVTHRCLGWIDLDEPRRVLLTEHDRDRRWLTTWICDFAGREERRILFDHSMDDAYADPGSPLMATRPDGRRTVLQDGPLIYLRGDGATPDGDRPFLDRFDLQTLHKERLYTSPADALDHVLGFPAHEGDGEERGEVLLWHESPAEPPNLYLTALDGSGSRALTGWPDPHPQLTGMHKRLIVHDRGDGVQLSGMLHLPPGYDPAAAGRLPLVIWAYPLDYGDASTAGQVRGSTQRFTRLNALEPTWFVLRGYAVLSSATMPVIGDPETMNDTFVEQVTAAAGAHIRALDEMGIADPERVFVGGHSYGGFMTANLLAHTDLFRAGIARSGAYNRTLTPFGFQAERRSFWEAPGVYDQLSPFRFADRITSPILLIHGEQDNNSGTFPIQSERLYQAIQGNGGTARLVLLPHESHGYLARESVLHVLAEQFDWLRRWAG
ncbi:MAG TPA: prolyl oligopeptidase family serine peptidase, partial [Streptosporangiaceae bacterium]|nr:prolyl oligopeptidase family serine peptidase [Streptosporangiaceae bacterium]